MPIPTEPIGSVPRPPELQAAVAGNLPPAELDRLFAEAVKDTIAELEATGSPVLTDGEQRKPSFVTYPIHGLAGLAAGGVVIPYPNHDNHMHVRFPQPGRS